MTTLKLLSAGLMVSAMIASPAMAWKFEVAPGAIGFVRGRGLGPEFQNDLFMGGATAKGCWM